MMVAMRSQPSVLSALGSAGLFWLLRRILCKLVSWAFTRSCIALQSDSHNVQVQDAASTRLGRNVDRGLCYGPSDFRVGGIIPIFGRDLFVHDCDQFTRDWYKVAQLQ